MYFNGAQKKLGKRKKKSWHDRPTNMTERTYNLKNTARKSLTVI